MKKLSILVVFSFFAICSFAQNVLSGKVTGKDSTALEGAIVYISDLKVGAVVHADGTYALENLPRGTYVVEVRFVGYASLSQAITIKGTVTQNFSLYNSEVETPEVVITGNARAIEIDRNPQPTAEITNDYLNENSATNVIDAIALTPGVSAMTDGQSISKPFIRGLGYNRVLTMADGVEQMDQAWFDEFGIEVDMDAPDRVEVLKGPGSLAYGSDAIAGVVNLIPEKPLPEGQVKGDILFNYQTNNGLINNMLHMAGTNKGVSWSFRVDHIMAHSYQNKYDGYVLNSQFSNTNADATIGVHRKLGFTQVHASYFDYQTGIVDGTRDSATGLMEHQVYYPSDSLTGPLYQLPTNQELKSYTPLVINQRIRHTKVVWDNSIAVGGGRITGTFSWQRNQRQETNDPTIPNTPDIYYFSDAATYDVRYISPDIKGVNISVGVNGNYQASQSLGTLMLIPNYNIAQVGGFAIVNYRYKNLTLTGGLRYDYRYFKGVDHWVDSTQVPIDPTTPGPDAIHEFQGFTSNFSGLSASIGASYLLPKHLYLKGNVARGYRAPNVAECAANGVHDGTVIWEIGNPDLKPESSIEGDLAFGMNSKDVGFEIDGFYNYLTNFIYAQGLQSQVPGVGDSINDTFDGIGLGPAPVYKYTQGTAALYGMEAQLDIHPAKARWFEFDAGFSMVSGGLKNVPDSIKVLPFVPPARLTAELKFHIEKLGMLVKNAYVKFGMQYTFEQKQVYLQYAVYNGLSPDETPYEYQASRSATKGYALFHVGVGGDVQSRGRTICKLYFVVNNMFNTPYIDYMSRFKYLPVNPLTNRVGVFNMGVNASFKVIIPFEIKVKS